MPGSSNFQESMCFSLCLQTFLVRPCQSSNAQPPRPPSPWGGRPRSNVAGCLLPDEPRTQVTVATERPLDHARGSVRTAPLVSQVFDRHLSLMPASQWIEKK